MSKRYGRSQKRKHKEYIEFLERSLHLSQRRLSRCKEYGYKKAFENFCLHNKIYENAILHMATQIGKNIDQRVAETLKEAASENMTLNVDEEYSINSTVDVVRIEVPSFGIKQHVVKDIIYNPQMKG